MNKIQSKLLFTEWLFEAQAGSHGLRVTWSLLSLVEPDLKNGLDENRASCVLSSTLYGADIKYLLIFDMYGDMVVIFSVYSRLFLGHSMP